MRLKTFATFLILISATLAYGIQAETEWIKFTSPEGRFSLLLPHEPKLEVVSDPTDAKLTHHRFSEFEQGYAERSCWVEPEFTPSVAASIACHTCGGRIWTRRWLPKSASNTFRPSS